MNRLLTAGLAAVILSTSLLPLSAQEAKKAGKAPTIVPVALLQFQERGRDTKDLGPKVTDLLFAKLVTNPDLFLVDRQELDKLQKEATDLEADRDTALKNAGNSAAHGSAMGVAGSLYQIAIEMGSICLVAKRKWLWFVSLALAALATYQMISVWLMP